MTFTDADRQLLLALRRDLHQNPELSWKESATQARLERALADIGVTDVRRVATTGLVARIPGKDRRLPAVAVRGDIDALPITEATGLDYSIVRMKMQSDSSTVPMKVFPSHLP